MTRSRLWTLPLSALTLTALVAAPADTAIAASSGQVPVITEFSVGCPGQNNEVEQAADPLRGYVYEEWMGCNGSIGFATSSDGGLSFGTPVVLPASFASWDPSVAVAPNGTVYAAFMYGNPHHTYPVVDASFNHGKTFPQVRKLQARQYNNWGDRDFIAVGPTGTVYLTWDYGPSAADIKYICSKTGSCAFAAGDLNVVIQKSTNGGRTWGRIMHVSPGFPASGADSAPLLVAPNGTIYVAYQGYHMTSRTKFTMTNAHTFFTSSSNGGRTWSRPVLIGPPRLTMDKQEWWIDGDISMDAGGNLYVTWDTQGRSDIGWLSYSTDHGKRWSRLFRVTPDADKATHIVQVTGGRKGMAYVAWLADNSRQGYALYLRPFSIRTGWLSGPIRVSQTYGNSSIWPGDTIGISFEQGPISLPPVTSARPPVQAVPRVVVSWGSAVGGSKAISQDRAALVTF